MVSSSWAGGNPCSRSSWTVRGTGSSRYSSMETSAVAAEEGPERAIAVGDFYFAKATRLIAEMGNAGVTSALAEALEAICASQIDDVALRGAFPGDRESYLRVVRGKTASLFAAACASGALLSGAEPEVVNALRRYGDL